MFLQPVDLHEHILHDRTGAEWIMRQRQIDRSIVVEVDAELFPVVAQAVVVVVRVTVAVRVAADRRELGGGASDRRGGGDELDRQCGGRNRNVPRERAVGFRLHEAEVGTSLADRAWVRGTSAAAG